MTFALQDIRLFQINNVLEEAYHGIIDFRPFWLFCAISSHGSITLNLGYLSFIGFVLAIVAVATGSKIIKVDPKDKKTRAQARRSARFVSYSRFWRLFSGLSCFRSAALRQSSEQGFQTRDIHNISLFFDLNLLFFDKFSLT